MVTPWPCHAIIVTASMRAACDALAVYVGIAPAGTVTLIEELVPIDGPDDAEPTHYGVCGSMSPEHRAALLEHPLSSGEGIWWARWTNHGSDQGLIESSSDDVEREGRYDWQKVKFEHGLKSRRTNPFPNI